MMQLPGASVEVCEVQLVVMRAGGGGGGAGGQGIRVRSRAGR